MRILSLNFREALFGSESKEVPVFLITITHPSLAQPERLTTDPTARISTDPLMYGTVSRGETYLYTGADITLPNEEDKNPPASRLSISNVARGLIPLARSVTTPPQIKIEAVLASALDDVEFDFPQMDMTNLTYDAAQLIFDLTIDSLATEAFPSGTFAPSYFPGLFY